MGGACGLIGSLVYLYPVHHDFYETNKKVSTSKSIQESLNGQEVKLTHTQTLPVTEGTVKVVPDNFSVSTKGTLLSAKVIGPNYTETKPSVMIKGTFSADISLTESDAASGGSSTTTATNTSTSSMSVAGLGNEGIAQRGTVISPNRLVSSVVGTVSLDYEVISTSGLQGKLSYLWSFNGRSIGNSASVDVDVLVTAEMVEGFEYNKANVLGVISVTVTDSFGRSASASESITVGNPHDLRSFVPELYEQRGYIDPIERVGQRLYGDPACIVGWQQEGGAVAQQLGALKSISTITINGKDYAIIGTQKI